MTLAKHIDVSMFEDIITDDSKFSKKLNGAQPLTIKWGADPSAPDLHLGHFVILNQLANLQRLGHTVLFVIGDFTARIGDPTGKSVTRQPLTEDDVKKNSETYLNQVFKVLDSKKTQVSYNAQWLNALSATEIVHLSSKYNVARMLERDDFSKRFKGNVSIGVHEFLYPLFQGYDSVHLKNDVEIGGTDQKFNLLVGRHLQKEFGQVPQSIITLPILEGLDGVKKMSKSLNNHIAILDSADDMFGKLMSISDNKIIRYSTLLANYTPKELIQIQEKLNHGENPRDIKMDMAINITQQFHSKKAANDAKDTFIHVVSNKQQPSDIPEISIPSHTMLATTTFLCDQKLAPSKKEARRLIEQGAVSINDEKISNPNHEFQAMHGTVIKVGKRKYLKIIS